MKKLFWMAAAAVCLGAGTASAQSSGQQNYDSYGQQFENTTTLSPGRLPVMMQKVPTLEDVALMGYVTEVCQKEGCWLKLSTQKNGIDEVMVKMKDHAFLLPKDIAGRLALVHGTITKKEISVEEQKHYLKDAGASQTEIDQITAPKEGYVMIADGVKVTRE